MLDTPPPDLDVPAARAADARYRTAIAAGAPQISAWAEALQIFRMHHPVWAPPMAEREAARLVGTFVGIHDTTGDEPTGTYDGAPPLSLLRRLAAPLEARTSSTICHAVDAGTAGGTNLLSRACAAAAPRDGVPANIGD